MKDIFVHFSTYLMLLLSLAVISLATVSSEKSHLKTLNPCFPKQKGTVYPVKGKCTSFIQCQDGDPVELSCPLGDGFSMTAKGCINIQKSDCMEIIPTTTAPNDCNQNERSSENKAQCVDQPVDARRPYVGDCTKFLICDCEYPTIKSCSNGLWFNAKLKACDLPQKIDCPWAMMINSTESNIESMETSTSIVESTVSIESRCLNQFNNSIYPYYENNTQFIYCHDNIATLHSCPRGFYFDDELLICTQDDCNDNDDSDDTNCNRVESTEATPKEKCAHHQAGSVLPIDDSCDSYILCEENGQAMILKCPANNYFDPTTRTCEANASSTICKVKQSVVNSRICSNHSIAGQIEEHPYNCRKYISCVLPVPIAFDCSSNRTFNPKTLRCEIPIDDKCNLKAKTNKNTPSLNVCDGIENNDTLPYNENHQFYIRCQGSSYMLESCNMQQFYDPRSRSCRVSQSSEAADLKISTEFSSFIKATFSIASEDDSTPFDGSEETTLISDQTTNEPTTLGSRETTIFDSVTTTSTTIIELLLCYNEMERALIPHPNLCNIYISCDPVQPIIYRCPTGLEFSTKILACVHPDDSGCKRSNRELKVYEENICCGKPMGTLLPYPNDAARFILCHYPIPSTYNCPAGTLYSSESEQCSIHRSYDATEIVPEEITIRTKYFVPDPVSTADPCSDSTSTQNEDSFTISLDSSTETIDPLSIDTTTSLIYPIPVKNDDASTICKGQAYGSQFQFVGNCSKYYFCLNNGGGGEVFECVSGWYFDPKKKLCVSPSSYQCPW